MSGSLKASSRGRSAPWWAMRPRSAGVPRLVAHSMDLSLLEVPISTSRCRAGRRRRRSRSGRPGRIHRTRSLLGREVREGRAGHEAHAGRTVDAAVELAAVLVQPDGPRRYCGGFGAMLPGKFVAASASGSSSPAHGRFVRLPRPSALSGLCVSVDAGAHARGAPARGRRRACRPRCPAARFGENRMLPAGKGRRRPACCPGSSDQLDLVAVGSIRLIFRGSGAWSPPAAGRVRSRTMSPRPNW